MKPALLAGLALPFLLSAADITPPGQRPRPLGAHALVNARVVVKPGTVLEGATIIIRNGRIQAVLPKGNPDIPADARVWVLSGKTVYAGFIDPYLSLGDAKAKPVSNRWTQPIDARAGVNFTGVPTTKTDMGDAGPGYEVAEVRPHFRVSDKFSPDAKALAKLRELGFAAANFIPTEGIYRGSSALALLGEGNPNRLILKPKTFQHLTFAPATDYPKSLMGVIAVTRQTVFDTQHYFAMKDWAMRNPAGPRPEYNPALEAMYQPTRSKTRQPIVIETGSVLMVDRAARLSEELGFRPIYVATGHEWRRPDLIKNIGSPFIVPVAFPTAPKLPDADDWTQVSLDQLRTWDWSPEIPALLAKNDRPIAFTLHGLANHQAFRKNLRQAISRGLKEPVALAALTTVPARLLEAGNDLGTIEKGKLANLTIVEGSYFDAAAPLHSTWVEGRPYLMDAKKDGDEKDKKRTAPKPDKRAAKQPNNYRGPLKTPKSIIITNVTIWTCGPAGVIKNGYIKITNGLIVAVGKNASAPTKQDALVIDAKGRHVTPGLIDCHNHSMILGGVNEGTLPSTAMVRIGDVVNSETENIYRQLAGGLTTANLLHGSANPIGGQNQVIKLRWGEAPDDLKFKDAPAGIKFALGENVKQSNWGDDRKTRFPQTRMGVRTFFNNRFTAARQYLGAIKKAKATDPPIRRNLELEAIGEIIEAKRWIHCHSYRQDEMLIFLRTMERFGVTVGTLQHVLEGYKIADEIATHGAGASAFSDWWAYKFEVYDAIPYAGALMHERGAVVSFNSDSSDLARRLNLEAAKAVKYGGLSDEDALNFVTINPAKQLKIEKWVGSLEKGKHADFVIWSDHPLSTMSMADETWIEGKQFYDRAKAHNRAKALATERDALIAKAKDSAKGDKGKSGEAARATFFRRALETAHEFRNCYECRKGKP